MAGALRIGALLVVVGILMRPAGEAPAPAPSATATSTTAVISPSPAASPSATPSASPSGLASGRHTNLAVGYSIDLPSPWHRSDCGSFEPGEGSGGDAYDLFIAVPDRELAISSTGVHVDHVSVFARDNPQRLTPRQWEQAGNIGFSQGRTLQDVTFAGRPALLATSGDNQEIFLVGEGDRMFQVAHQAVTGTATRQQREAIVRSFRFLSPDELRVARAAPTPSAPPPRTPEEVADALADGFAKRDIAILSRVITPSCMSIGVAQGGGSAVDDARYLEELRDRFARGLTVSVQPRPLAGTRTGERATLHARSTWREPGQPDLDVDLMISPQGATWYWRGTVTYTTPRPP